MPEINKLKEEIAPWLVGCVLDLGCGRNKVADYAVGVDFGIHYDGKMKGLKLGTAANITSGWEALHEFCVEHKSTFDTLFSSHLLEDYRQPYGILLRWLRLVRIGGRVILLLPIEQKYREATGGKSNRAHKSEWLGATDFIERLPEKVAERVHVLYAQEEIGRWSFMVVFRRDK